MWRVVILPLQRGQDTGPPALKASRIVAISVGVYWAGSVICRIEL